MDHLIYLFLAFLFLWGLVFIYLFKLFRRQKELLDELRRLQGILGEYQQREEQFKSDRSISQ